MRNSQLVIQGSLQPEILQKLHSEHQGISKCCERARHSVWWPGISKDLEAEVKRCVSCCKAQVQCAEPLIPTEFPQLPWQRIGTDLLEYNGSKYVLVVDYFSRYIELPKLSSTDANTVINQFLLDMESRKQLPQTMAHNIQLQFSPSLLKTIALCTLQAVLSSPKKRRIKNLLKKCSKKAEDPYLALMAYRATPLACGYSPAELLMGRAIRTTVPMSRELLKPTVPDLAALKRREQKANEQQKLTLTADIRLVP